MLSSLYCIYLKFDLFAKVSAIDNDYNFANVGDWRCTSDTKKSKFNPKYQPSFIINLGDLSYKMSPDCWFEIVDPIDENMKITIGNHDVLNLKLLKQYMDHFGLNKQCYSFDYNNIHFVAMSTKKSYLPGSEKYKFVTKD